MAQLGTFEGNIADFNPNTPFAGDERLPVEFYMGAIQNADKSTEAGRPIFEDTECIRIFNSKDNIIDRPVRDTDKRRWPSRYNAWKAGNQDAGVVGTRLENWPVFTRAQAEEFKFFKIFTVEQLAEAPDSLAHNFMGFQKFKSLAKQTLELARGEAPLLKAQEELASRDAKIAQQDDLIAKLTARLDAMEGKQKKG